MCAVKEWRSLLYLNVVWTRVRAATLGGLNFIAGRQHDERKGGVPG